MMVSQQDTLAARGKRIKSTGFMKNRIPGKQSAISKPKLFGSDKNTYCATFFIIAVNGSEIRAFAQTKHRKKDALYRNSSAKNAMER